MGVARTWVFPIIRIVLVAAVAAALIKIAFFPDTAAASDPAQPTGSASQPQYVVAKGGITNDVTLPGTVTADAAVPVRASALGTVDEFFASQGQSVAAGDPLFDIKVETVRDPVETTGPDGSVQISQPEPLVSYTKVLAPASGVLSSLSVLHGQALSVGDTAGQIAPPSFSVTGTLSPDQQYRLTTQPTEATIAITNGPAPFTCTGLSISTPLAGEGDAPDAAQTTTVRCTVPAEVTVFPGLAATITIAAGAADDVLVIPTTAVQGSAQTGTVWLLADDGATSEHPVTLGLTDGSMVEVSDGLAEGDAILEFVPGAPPAVDPGMEGCKPVGGGGMVCSGVGG